MCGGRRDSRVVVRDPRRRDGRGYDPPRRGLNGPVDVKREVSVEYGGDPLGCPTSLGRRLTRFPRGRGASGHISDLETRVVCWSRSSDPGLIRVDCGAFALPPFTCCGLRFHFHSALLRASVCVARRLSAIPTVQGSRSLARHCDRMRVERRAGRAGDCSGETRCGGAAKAGAPAPPALPH